MPAGGPARKAEGMRILPFVTVRSAVLIMVEVVLLLVTSVTADASGGADIGSALAAFAVTLLIALVWAGFDARSHGFSGTIKPWLYVAGATAVGWLLALVVQAFALFDVGSPGDLLPVTVSGLSVLPFVFGLVALPALIGAAVGSAGRRGSGR